jgi:cupin 2 domain-containing protein
VNIRKQNIYNQPEGDPGREEVFESLVKTPAVLIERIISVGNATPEGEWYDQDRDEWVILLGGNAILAFDDGTAIQLIAGDHILIPAHCRHRVDFTSSQPPCTWLAVHADLCK